MNLQPNNRQRALAALAVLRDGSRAGDLAEFMSDHDRKAYSPLVRAYSNEPNRELSMGQLIKHLVSSERFSSLAEVHPAWVLERLRNEPPRVIGIILRLLPSRHVRYLLKNLPPMLCEQVPNLVESFSVDPAILDVIRRRFEKHFVPMRITRSIDELGFENLYYLKESELEELFVDIGLTEMAIALSDLPSKALRIVYNRLDVKDAKRLKARIGGLTGVPDELFRQARNTFLQVEGERVGPRQLLKMVGLAAFADAIGPEHENLMSMVKQRLDPNDGYLLKRFVDERRIRKGLVSAGKRRQMIMEAVAELAREGRIDKSWSGFLPARRPEPSSGSAFSRARGAEETNTAHQLA